MKKKYKIISFFSIVILLFFVGLIVHRFAEQHRQKDKGEEPISREKNDLNPVINLTYKTSCEGCHFPYPPALLPASSWGKIINQLDNHFGEQVPIDPKSREVILKYLTENGADRSSANKAVKIMKSLNGKTPLRITEIPYIQKKHREIKPEVLNRKAIGSLSNCTACHRTAEQGNFDDDRVAIPK